MIMTLKWWSVSTGINGVPSVRLISSIKKHKFQANSSLNMSQNYYPSFYDPKPSFGYYLDVMCAWCRQSWVREEKVK